MKAIIQKMKDLTDSRELLESKPHPVIPIFIYSLIGMILIALIWSYFGEIDENIKAQGIVRPNEKISLIKNKVAGKVTGVNLKEGKKVKKGEILFTIEHTSQDLQRDIITKDYEKTKQELENIRKLRQSILDEKNYFQENSEVEKEYYNKYQKYQTDLEVQSKQIQLDSSSANKINEALRGLKIFKQSILKNKNMFLENSSIYYNQYIDYSLNIKSMKSNIEQKKESYVSIKELEAAGASSRKELNDANKQLEGAEIELEKYQNEALLNINTKIEDYEKSLEALDVGLKTSQQTIGSSQPPIEVSMQKFKMDTLVQLEADIATTEKNVEKLESELKSAQLNEQDCIVTSPIDGRISISTEINQGDLLASETEVASIVPDNNTQYKVQLYVSNSDIANIKVGEKIKYHFLALPYREYGELTGKIATIGTDAKVNQEKGSSFYIVEAYIENRPLFSYKGAKAEIKIGMACEAQVITKSKKILYYLLEKINLKD